MEKLVDKKSRNGWTISALLFFGGAWWGQKIAPPSRRLSEHTNKGRDKNDMRNKNT